MDLHDRWGIINRTVNFCVVLLFAISCVEPFEPQTAVFESVLIVEATITDEDKRQQIFLSRAFRLEEDGPNPETSATVRVTDDQRNEYVFVEEAPGVYLSQQTFRALRDRTYALSVLTSDGRSYSSEQVALTPSAEITALSASREFNLDGEEGMAILLDNEVSDADARFFRYEYEETYKIIAPRWVAVDAVVIRERPPPAIIILEPKTREERVCYNTAFSNTVILGETEGIAQNGLKRFSVRFIKRDNFIISHRYSILVRQFVQSPEAFAFYETLNEFSSASENLFSQIQPGFLNGNVLSDESGDEKVLGFFQVSSVASQRMFFDYVDFFPGEALPPYAEDCELELTPNLLPNAPGGASPLVQAVQTGRKYISDSGDAVAPFIMVNPACGNCNVLGSNVVPEFWTEE